MCLLQAQKEGVRKTVYGVSGTTYVGEWRDNLKHGMECLMEVIKRY